LRKMIAQQRRYNTLLTMVNVALAVLLAWLIITSM
jgi:hypothetical protein